MILHSFALLFAIPLLVSAAPPSVSIIDFVEKRCAGGDERSCERLAELDGDLKRHKRLLGYSIKFDEAFRGQDYTYDNKPDLEGAYGVVLDDFFTEETAAGFEDRLLDNNLAQCASHYHNHWRNRKLWWPTDGAGKPDWQKIYVYVVDHYYGYCLRLSSNLPD